MRKDSTIGNINGKWAQLFKMLLSVNAILVPLLFAWASWVTTNVYQIRQDVLIRSQDRFTAGMAIEAWDLLSDKNMGQPIEWLTAREVRDIQQRYNP